jgi:hypothetical protein
MPPLTPSSPYGGSCVGGAGLLHNLDTEGQIFVPRQMLLMARVRDHPFMMQYRTSTLNFSALLRF